MTHIFITMFNSFESKLTQEMGECYLYLVILTDESLVVPDDNIRFWEANSGTGDGHVFAVSRPLIFKFLNVGWLEYRFYMILEKV